MIPLYDAHNHLHDERLAANLDEILQRLPNIGLKRCVVNGTSEKDWSLVAELAKRCDWVLPAFGLHPWFAKERSPQWFDTLRKLLDEIPRASIGEIGLDRWMKDPDLDDQQDVFVKQLELAAERNVAASVHCLKAWGHLETGLKSTNRPARGFLIHSYGGSAEMLNSFCELGAYFSISGYFAHERKAAQREVFKLVASDRFLVETDAPDMLPPEPLQVHRGEVNDPQNISAIYRFAAELRGQSESDLARSVEQNFVRLFGAA
jgi:TatD DNase family protein